MDLTAFKNGNEQALKQVFDTFLDPLIFFAYKLIGNRQEAEDISLNAIYKLWERHAQFETIDNVRAFLYVCARNNCLNYLKAQQRKTAAQRELYHITDSEASHAEVEEHVHLKMINAHLLQRLHEEVATLPAQCKNVVSLSFEGYSNSQIASKLNTTVNTVLVQKTRGLHRLKESVIKKKLLKPSFTLVIGLLTIFS
jgi:RNA polymerase sigma-70 factor (family 1)